MPPDNNQVAPFPMDLAELVEKATYRDGWLFSLEFLDRGQGSEGLTLVILALVENSFADKPDQEEWRKGKIRVRHLMPVPPAAYDRETWARWLLDQVLLVEAHEACEFFKIDGKQPFAPHHGPGRNPYNIYELGTDEQRRTASSGDINES